MNSEQPVGRMGGAGARLVRAELKKKNSQRHAQCHRENGEYVNYKL